MMSRKEYMYWQNRKDRVSEYILCERAIFGVFNSFTVKKVSIFAINVKFKVILSSNSGGMFVQAIPPTQKSGGGGIHPPIPPGIYASALSIDQHNSSISITQCTEKLQLHHQYN